jgi:hypothetical protein
MPVDIRVFDMQMEGTMGIMLIMEVMQAMEVMEVMVSGNIN